MASRILRGAVPGLLLGVAVAAYGLGTDLAYFGISATFSWGRQGLQELQSGATFGCRVYAKVLGFAEGDNLQSGERFRIWGCLSIGLRIPSSEHHSDLKTGSHPGVDGSHSAKLTAKREVQNRAAVS